jgi:hypothetical protein
MRLPTIALFCIINCLQFASATPVDELRLGKNEGYPVGTRLNHSEDKYRVGSYTNWEKLHWTGLVRASGARAQAGLTRRRGGLGKGVYPDS